MTKVAILWHMHQPFYEDLVSHEHILPWVRLHALKDYYGMVALLREFPDVQVTFNLVPSLLVQLEAFAEGRARDRHLEAGLKPAADLNEADAAFISEHFFHANREHLISLFPRYVELSGRRGSRFSVEDLRDLQVLHKLAWIDPLYHDGDARVRALTAKGRDFNEDDKAVLREVELEILNKVIPEYREAQARGQIELSTSPFYHPILPLLCDTDIYLRTHPDSGMPRRRFQRPEDAAEQLRSAVGCFERLFGRRPDGLWPSEGSVSDAMVPLVAEAGLRWMATDEQILARTLGATFTRDAHGQLEQPELLYGPRQVRVGEASVACGFRDHLLSDLIGFTYAGWGAEAAADDFCVRLVEAGRRYRERTGGGEATITIILDGENAWENFPGGGRPFLRALYARLASSAELRTVTMSEACASPAAELAGIFPGSWIDANFYIWIGHADDHIAWTQLAEARQVLDETAAADAAAAARARQEILVAEGSDWFWWYGDDHSSDHDATFDDLFRKHLRNVYQLLDRPIPGDLFVTNISTTPRLVFNEPTGLLTPALDGEESSYFEWLGAGVVGGEESGGAMHQSEPQARAVRAVSYGFDRERLFVRIDGAGPMVDLLAEGITVVIRFIQPGGFRFAVSQREGRVTAVLAQDAGTGPAARAPRFEAPRSGAVAAAGTILEVGIPFADLGAEPGALISFFIAVLDAGGVDVDRRPANTPIEVRVPDERFAARGWNA